LFVQIGDENVHLVRNLLDEVFGRENFIANIAFGTTTGKGAKYIDSIYDTLLWYAKDSLLTKYRQIYKSRDKEAIDKGYEWLETDFGEIIKLNKLQLNEPQSLPLGRRFMDDNLSSQGVSTTGSNPFEFQGRKYSPPSGRHWRVNIETMPRLANANRLMLVNDRLCPKTFAEDFGYIPLPNLWTDTAARGFVGDPKVYVVQTPTAVIARCMLMTTDPGDLVFDPTCGSGTTAYVAEQWGRRWITIDTSRVAIALARQRLLTAKYDYYELADYQAGPAGSFVYKTVPHITLKSIAQNQALDPVFAKWEPLLAEKLAVLNAALAEVTPEIRARLQAKLAAKERQEGKKAITDADRRRWLLPKEKWEEWEVPFDTDPDWPAELQAALLDYRQAWRGKMDEVNAVIAASAPQETLVDQPQITPGVLRVSGPFTVEGVQPVEKTLDVESPISGEPEEMETFAVEAGAENEPQNAAAYLDKMIRLLRQDGVRFPDNKVLHFDRLEPLANSVLHAEGEWGSGVEVPTRVPTEFTPSRRVAVSFGPQYGPITAQQVEECLREAYRRGYDDLIFAGFTIDGAAQAIIQEDPNPKVRCHLAHIRPDVNMGGLLKDTPSSQLFTVFGLPRVNLIPAKSGEWIVEMEGVDIYDPVENTIRSTGADKVAAWFLDSDYDGQTFCITQAFFPDSSAWDKLAKALKTTVDLERFAAFSGTRSLPFAEGKYGRVAVKVIDPRGNEVMRVMNIAQ
jgi:adenine-specific DNA-methyltransferase